MKKLSTASPAESQEPFPFNDEHPSRWAEYFLCLFLKPNARESIPGDLLEEYREAILPKFGALRAHLWYLTQVLSLVWHLIHYSTVTVITNVQVGLALGIVFSIIIALTNVVLPLIKINIPDAILINVAGWGGVFFLFGVAGFIAFRRTGAFSAAFKAGAIVALVSFAIAMLTFIIVDNLFLDLVSRQPEKIWLFQYSNYHSMRAYINYTHARGVVFVLPVLTIVGSLAGATGGLVSKAGDALR